MKEINFGLVINEKNYWGEGFETALKKRNLTYKKIEIDRDDWLDQVADVQNIITRFPLKFADEGKEKLYVLESILKKNVYPNQATFWHYDNKNAQKYLSQINKNIPLPKSFVSYSYKDALNYLKSASYPIVSKSSHGASSKNVRLLKNYSQAKKELDFLFDIGEINRLKSKFFRKIGLLPDQYSFQKNYVHYQEFIPNNKGDLKIITIGDKYAYAYYRGNRDNDFRASGSGKNNYSPDKHNIEAILHFLKISRENNFDSMGYDLLYTKDGYVTVEISYTTVEKYLYNCEGYYELKNGKLEFINEHTWPQELIIKYLEEKWNNAQT